MSRKLVRRSYLAIGANDDNAAINHQYFPYRQDSRCQYQAEIFNKHTPPHHPNYLSQTVVELIFTLLTSLSTIKGVYR